MSHPPLMLMPDLSDRGTILPHSDKDKGVELFYAPSESIFAAVAAEMVSLGWSIYPQSSDGRFPGRVFHDPIRWSEEHDLKNKLPTEAALRLWKAHCATLNVACVFGPGSSNTFAIDIDCPDAAIARHVTNLADEILGYLRVRDPTYEPLVLRRPPWRLPTAAESGTRLRAKGRDRLDGRL